MKNAIEQGNISKLITAIEKESHSVNEDISFGPKNEHHVHPINFICHCVFENKISEDTALEMVRTLINHGSNKDGNLKEGKDTPLIAASSLYCDEIAIFLVDLGANLAHKGTHGGTCLHWACWTGADRLLQEKVDLEDSTNEFGCSPLLWGIDGLVNGKGRNIRNQHEVIDMLLRSGANPNTKDNHGNTPVEILAGKKKEAIIELLYSFGAAY